jgi:hypothetical protein
VADLLATALLASLVLAFSDVALSRLPIEAGLPAAFLLSGGVAALAIAHWRLRAVRRDAEAHRAIAPVVHAYILLLSSLAAVSRPNWTPALSLLYGCFLVAMARRPSREQI